MPNGRGWMPFLRYDEEQDRPKISWALIRRALAYGRPYIGRIAAMLLLILVVTLLVLAPPPPPPHVPALLHQRQDRRAALAAEQRRHRRPEGGQRHGRRRVHQLHHSGQRARDHASAGGAA